MTSGFFKYFTCILFSASRFQEIDESAPESLPCAANWNCRRDLRLLVAQGKHLGFAAASLKSRYQVMMNIGLHGSGARACILFKPQPWARHALARGKQIAFLASLITGIARLHPFRPFLGIQNQLA